MINLLAYASGRLDVTLAALVPIAPRPPDRLGDAPAPWSRVAALASEDQDVARAMLRLTEVVDTELALVKPETIARWSEDTTRTRTATSARASLTGRFRLWRTTTQLFAGPRRARPASPSPPMSRPTNARTTDIHAATARQRDLHSRYLGRAQERSATREGLPGPAARQHPRGHTRLRRPITRTTSAPPAPRTWPGLLGMQA